MTAARPRRRAPDPSALAAAVARFGADAAAKLDPAVDAQPEDQLRGPLENLFADLAAALGYPAGSVVPVGEARLASLRTRPDYAIKVDGTVVGYVEVKAPAKPYDPRQFAEAHDRDQWDRLKAVSNLLYTNGGGFTHWRDGRLQSAVGLGGDVRTVGADLTAPPQLADLFERFLGADPVKPRTAKELAALLAHRCRLMRAEVAECLAAKVEPFVGLAADWRQTLFPEATDAQFADGYAQAVTFGLLLAKSYDIDVSESHAAGLHAAAKALGRRATVMGAALGVLTDPIADAGGADADFPGGGPAPLETSLGELRRQLAVVDWAALAGGDADAWLYFYEDFLQEYDAALRRETGSYYTPPRVVAAMCRLTDELLKSPARFGLRRGLADASVTVADPAVGTGTFLLGVLRRIRDAAVADRNAGRVPELVAGAAGRLTGFERQLGPYAVAQVRVRANLHRGRFALRLPSRKTQL